MTHAGIEYCRPEVCHCNLYNYVHSSPKIASFSRPWELVSQIHQPKYHIHRTKTPLQVTITPSKIPKQIHFPGQVGMKIGRKPEGSLPEEDDPAQSKERLQTGTLDKNMIRVCDEIVSIRDILD